MRRFAMKEQRPMEQSICFWDHVLCTVLCTKLLFQEAFTPPVILGSDSLERADTDTGSHSVIQSALLVPGRKDFFAISLILYSLLYLQNTVYLQGDFLYLASWGKCQHSRRGKIEMWTKSNIQGCILEWCLPSLSQPWVFLNVPMIVCTPCST